MHAHPRHLPAAQQQQLATLTAGIKKAFNPEAILCFGCHFTCRHRWSCFTSPEENSYIHSITYDLLIVDSTRSPRSYHETVQMVEQQAAQVGCRVNVLVHHLKPVQDGLQKGHYFFGKVCRQGVWLYKKQEIAIPTIPPEEIAHMDTLWSREITRAKQFYNQAKMALSNDWYELTAFLLHQAVQHACIALFKAILGYYTNTHNLTRLLNLTGNFSHKLIDLFPANTREEEALLQLLHNAYSDARYSDEYSVSKTQAAVLAARVKLVLKAAEHLYSKVRARQEKQSVLALLGE